MAGDKTDAYKSEIRTLRAWAYYNVYEIWGPAIPLYTESDMNTASADYGISFEEGQKKVFDFLVKELDESLAALPVESGGGETHTVMNQALNRLLMARVFLNANVLFAVGDHFTECEQICDDILAGHYGKYSLETDWRKLYDLGNEKSPEIIFAFATQDGQGANQRMTNTRMVGYAYNIWEYCSTDAYDGIGAWNCVCLVPSYDNSGTVQPLGGTDNPRCFLDAPYGDKLGAVYERMQDGDSRKQPYTYLNGNRQGMFLMGVQRADFGTGETLKADADRDGQDLCYVDQVGTFLEKEGHALETVQSSRWGETNSGYRLMKYPLYAKTASGTVKQYIPVLWATSFSEIATAVLNGVTVTDGTVELGMVSEKKFTNWEVIQIKGVTALVDATVVHANTLSKAIETLNDAAYVNVTGFERTTLSQTISNNTTVSEQTAEAYQTAVNALEMAMKAFTDAKASYDAWVDIKGRNFPYASVAKKDAAESAVAVSPTSAADVVSRMETLLPL